jgi:hypothetical protein
MDWQVVVMTGTGHRRAVMEWSEHSFHFSCSKLAAFRKNWTALA